MTHLAPSCLAPACDDCDSPAHAVAPRRRGQKVRRSEGQKGCDPILRRQIGSLICRRAAILRSSPSDASVDRAVIMRAEFGRSSEKLMREAEQFELAIETLKTDQAQRLAVASPETVRGAKPAGHRLPEHPVLWRKVL